MKVAAAVFLAGCLTLGLAAAEHEHAPPTVLAPGYADLEFVPPAPGSYRLPLLGDAADGEVLDSAGAQHRLHDFFADRFVILSFIYTRCGDANGCPLATHVLAGVQKRLLAEPDIAGKVRLLSLSFDPGHDTPENMGRYAASFRAPDSDWRFLTCASAAELEPLLTGYDQWVIRDVDAAGNDLGTLSHLLRVFLIDRDKKVRNIYSVSFLHADTLANDIRTLLLEER